ncbi:uncharacterized protein BDZ99DRAFT_466137 [Mytilinidion resinicola]|uniref:Uncharacterized protein n=1 Tax=Mytilinidion resinicola TaxID=574789 RepID=A0A6A6YDH0_9PEZI|nr:uncharacterized protein BDZ99DRAFT_466137 [Mytilinidion resinicola]KAF2806573.1 hypothetical protein BDZ99DRAFT_466137 [Mytilinidion resinicola]
MGQIRAAFLALFIFSAIGAILLESVSGHMQTRLQLLNVHDYEFQHSDFEPNVARPHLDYERCARLHNKIVEIGWRGYNPGKDPSLRSSQTWWERYGEDAKKLPLPISVIEFLKLAELPEDDLSFTFQLRGLSHPSELWNGLQELGYEATEIVLYSSANRESQGMGLIFNHELNLAVYSPTIFDHARNEALLYPLETALMMYLSMTNAGKIAAVPEGKQEDKPYSTPWAWQYYGEMDVKFAVDEFTNLIHAIINRISPEERSNSIKEFLDPNKRSPLIDTGTLHALNMPTSFLRLFLSRAPKPPFSFVAPGLTIPTRSALSRLFASMRVFDMYSDSTFNSLLPPTLLFPSNLTLTSPPNASLSGAFLFGDPQTTLDGVTSGLYIVSQSEHYEPFTNGAKLILPFPLGANGFAKKANWQPIGSQFVLSQNYTDLYQMGSNSFIENHSIMLHQVFQSWRLMVEQGVWDVDDNGVQGGMEGWRLADDEKQWWRFKMDDALW